MWKKRKNDNFFLTRIMDFGIPLTTIFKKKIPPLPQSDFVSSQFVNHVHWWWKNSQKQIISIFLKDNSKSVLSKQKVKWNRVYHASFLKYKILFGMRISFGMEILRKGLLALSFFKTRKGTTQTKHACNLPFAEIFGPVLSPDSAFFVFFEGLA